MKLLKSYSLDEVDIRSGLYIGYTTGDYITPPVSEGGLNQFAVILVVISATEGANITLKGKVIMDMGSIYEIYQLYEKTGVSISSDLLGTAATISGELFYVPEAYGGIDFEVSSDNENDDEVSVALMVFDMNMGDDNNRVDVSKINGEDPIDGETIAADILLNTDNLLATDENGRVDIGQINGITQTTDLNDIKTQTDDIADIKTSTDLISNIQTTVNAINTVTAALHNFDPENDTVTLSSVGLDNIPITEVTGIATSLVERLNQLYQRFFYQISSTSSQIITYKSDKTKNTTQTVTDDGITKIVGEASA